MADPTLEVHPDFASNAYCIVREALMGSFNENAEQSIDRLNTTWDAEHDTHVEAWNLQREAEQRERDEEQERLKEAKAEKERKDAEKKKPKISDFNERRAPPSTIDPRPSQYAIQKISTFDFVELWYFSPEGCSDTICNQKSQADDAFGLTNSHDILTLCPIAAVKASRLARFDHDLSFSEMLQAKNLFLCQIKQHVWPSKHINALAEFFWNLENHPIRNNENGDTITLTYASHIRRQWHDDLKNNVGDAFNIVLINE
ncbi:hypothetical protein OG21DRAFT_1580388 [Imleria badia]|nr:hypothetical protein OG21DRAFT_1580388 [Imleria badia]